MDMSSICDKTGDDCEYSFRVGNWCVGIIIVDAESLLVPMTHQPYLIAGNGAIRIVSFLKDELTSQRHTTTR